MLRTFSVAGRKRPSALPHGVFGCNCKPKFPKFCRPIQNPPAWDKSHRLRVTWAIGRLVFVTIDIRASPTSKLSVAPITVHWHQFRKYSIHHARVRPCCSSCERHFPTRQRGPPQREVGSLSVEPPRKVYPWSRFRCRLFRPVISTTSLARLCWCRFRCWTSLRGMQHQSEAGGARSQEAAATLDLNRRTLTTLRQCTNTTDGRRWENGASKIDYGMGCL